ncbi:MAG TPA: LacI family DNA-binding transcriptional regulator, partial [Sphingobacterium sp.]|nr:LacI family DNA-binding transcriptional regulator [Sphingobacterium sp.]
MKKRKITISDVAREMRVSVTTVSFVLNGKAEGRVSPSVIRRVTDYANRIGYRPNPKSKKIQRDTVRLYGVLVDDISNTFQSQLVFHVIELLQKTGRNAIIMSMNGDGRRGERLYRSLEEMKLEGCVLMPFDNMFILQEVIQPTYRRIPMVVFDDGIVGEDITVLKPDYGMMLKEVLVDYMGTHGVGRVGLVTCPSHAYRTVAFLNGYIQAMDAVNGDVLIKKVQQSMDIAVVQGQIRDFVRDNRLDVVVFSTDRLALLASDVFGEETFGVKCTVSTTDAMSFGDKRIRQLILPL